MKKLLSLLGAASIVVSAGANVTACGTNNGAGDKVITEGNIGIGDDSVCKIVNIVANRHFTKDQMVSAGSMGNILGNENVTDQDILDGINFMNGTNLTLEDVDITVNDKKTMANVKTKPGSNFTGENDFLVNKGVKFEEYIKNTDLGDIYIPEKTKFPPTGHGLTQSIPQLTLLMEFVGDRNRQLEYITDAIAKLSTEGILNEKLFKIEENQASISLPSNDFITGEIVVKYTKHNDNRKKIKDLILETNLEGIQDKSDTGIVKEVYKKNKATLGSYSEAQILDALEVVHDKNKTLVQFKAGNNEFKGHDPASIFIINMGISGIKDKISVKNLQVEVTL